jgi:hypothetical protein
MILVVCCLADTADESMHYVDVGFSEPSPIHPLQYDEGPSRTIALPVALTAETLDHFYEHSSHLDDKVSTQ